MARQLMKSILIKIRAIIAIMVLLYPLTLGIMLYALQWFIK